MLISAFGVSEFLVIVAIYSHVDVCRHRCVCQHVVCVSLVPSCCKVHMHMCFCNCICVYVTVIVFV